MDSNLAQNNLVVSDVTENSLKINSYEGDHFNTKSRPRINSKLYNFDFIHPADTTQEEIYREISPLIDTVCDGKHVCIFAYG